jgi:hypothetical protein
MSRVPSVLGIGCHPSKILPSLTAYGSAWESALQYNKVSMYQTGTLFWAAPLTGLTAYINGTALNIPTGQCMVDPDNVDPIAVFDTGIPYIFGRVDVINKFYGAYGIGPSADGQCRRCLTSQNDQRLKLPFLPRLCSLLDAHQHDHLAWLADVSYSSTRCHLCIKIRSKSKVLYWCSSSERRSTKGGLVSYIYYIASQCMASESAYQAFSVRPSCAMCTRSYHTIESTPRD